MKRFRRRVAGEIPAEYRREELQHEGIMSVSAAEYEKLGQFYLGKEYDLGPHMITDDLVLYASKDLVTHGVVLGMTGSGKTGLCLALLEEASMDHVPAIVIDPRGDISSLLLTFPDLDAKRFRRWINEDDAAKKGVSPDAYAEKTAAAWKAGLAEWGQGPVRIQMLRDKVDINIFTSGSKAGIPVSILSSLEAPPFEVVDDGVLLGERIESTVSLLLSLVGVDADPIQSPEAVLLSTIFQHAWAAEQFMATVEDGKLVLQVKLIRPPEDEQIDYLYRSSDALKLGKDAGTTIYVDVYVSSGGQSPMKDA